MALFPFSAKDVLSAAQQLCVENPEATQSATSPDAAHLAAQKIVADANAINTAMPIGVAIAAANDRRLTTLKKRDGSPGRATNGADGDGDADAVGGERAPTTARGLLKESHGKKSTLPDCPYCSEPHRRFCPESGRRHETAEEKATRLWRTMYRQSLFSLRLAAASRINEENTCAEEFFVEI